MTESEKAVEAVAETIWRSEYRRATEKERSIPWGEVLDEHQERYRFIARDVLALPHLSAAPEGGWRDGTTTTANPLSVTAGDRREVDAERTDFRWLIEAPSARYLAVQQLRMSSNFEWTSDHNKALAFRSQEQADALMMALRQLDRELDSSYNYGKLSWGKLFAFEPTLGNARPVEHGWLLTAPETPLPRKPNPSSPAPSSAVGVDHNTRAFCLSLRGRAKWIEDGMPLDNDKMAQLLRMAADVIECASRPISGEREKIAPVQGYAAGIPWSMHLRAYDAYCKKYGAQPAMIDLEGRNCRGGFGVGELDMFIPGWRDELSEISKLKAEIARLTALTAPSAPALHMDDQRDGAK